MVFVQSRAAKVASIHKELAKQESLIIEIFFKNIGNGKSASRCGISSPFSYHLGIQGPDRREYSQIVGVFLHQISLLKLVFRSRGFLGSEDVNGYCAWSSGIRVPWVESEPDLLRSWGLIRETGYVYGEKFITWQEEFCGFRRLTQALSNINEN